MIEFNIKTVDQNSLLKYQVYKINFYHTSQSIVASFTNQELDKAFSI